MMGFCLTAKLYSQTEVFGDSRPISVAIIGNNLPVNAYVKKYVEAKIVEWQGKGEFEKTVDYQKRINEQTRNEQVQKYTDDAIAEMKKLYAASISWNNLPLSKYDADNETYLIQSAELGNFAIPVPLADAQSFKQDFSSMQFKNCDFYINNNKLVLAKVDVIATSGKIYQYNSNQATTYSSNNITYNFKPIVVDVAQDNIVQNNTKIENKNTTVGNSDVDVNIPLATIQKTNAYALIIGNEDYSSFQTGLSKEVNVDYAKNDAQIFSEYCTKTLGIPQKQIKLLTNATCSQMQQGLAWIDHLAKIENGNAELIFYFSGHGLPDETTKEPYIMPVDVNGTQIEFAIKLEDVYKTLVENPSKQVTVFLDACFSGGGRNEGLLAMKGVVIKPKSVLATKNLVVFTSSSGSESSAVYREKQHGYFTYFLLKKLQETKGDVDFDFLSDYISQSVSKETGLISKMQTPQVIISASILDTWQKMRLK